MNVREIEWGGMNLLIWFRARISDGFLWALQWTFLFHKIFGNFLSSWATDEFSRRTQLHGMICFWIRFQGPVLLQENARTWWDHTSAAVHLAMNLVPMEMPVKVLFWFNRRKFSMFLLKHCYGHH
jgi:hypothetical protein